MTRRRGHTEEQIPAPCARAESGNDGPGSLGRGGPQANCENSLQFLRKPASETLGGGLAGSPHVWEIVQNSMASDRRPSPLGAARKLRIQKPVLSYGLSMRGKPLLEPEIRKVANLSEDQGKGWWSQQDLNPCLSLEGGSVPRPS